MLFLEVTNPTFSWFSPFVVAFAGLAALIIAIAIPYLTATLVKYINTKHGYMVSTKDKDKFDSACETVVMVIEQNVRKALKLGEKAPEGAKRLEEGLGKLEALLKAEGIYDKFKDAMEDGLEKAVAKMNGPLTAAEKDEIRASLPPKGE